MELFRLHGRGKNAVTEHQGYQGIVEDGADGYAGLVGCAPCMLGLRKQIASIGKHDCTVLVCGESGTGKELVARHIHLAGPRAAGPFVIADCTALPETLVASQLFGHVKGAFTDAKESTLGLVRAAHGGTLLIDEIGELQLHSQAKLLRCIQEHSVVPVGAVEPIHVDVRILAATHRDLKDMVAQGRFREDLYYRLDVVRVEVPPLRERRGDIALLAEHFLEQHAALYGSPVKAFSDDAIAAMKQYAWLGNVRELRNAVERAVTLAEGDLLSLSDLPERMRQPRKDRGANRLYDQGDIPPLAVVERRLIDQALRATNGNLTQAAHVLEVERHRLSRMIRRHGLTSLIKALRAAPPKAKLKTRLPDSDGEAGLRSDVPVSPWAAAS
ncbi:MAG: sigma-54 interaction domain-containing protein [Phycisphaerae bacterium]